MAETLAWGIISTGNIARTFAQGLTTSRTGRLVAVGSRTQEAADRFGAEFAVAPPHRHADYDALLADPAVEAVYIATPHPMHAAWAIKAAERGKHILCEKPLTLNYAEAAAVVAASRRHDVFLMEAFAYRCHPQTARLVELIRAGAIGTVRALQATYSFDGGDDPDSRLLRKDLGGGGILDVGCYPMSLVRRLAGAATGVPFAEPIDLMGMAYLGARGHVDEAAIAALRFPGDILAQIATGIRLQQENVVRVCGSEGSIVVPIPFAPSRDGGPSTIVVQTHGQPSATILRDESEPGPREITIDSGIPAHTEAGLYGLEADTVAENLATRQAPAMTPDDSLGNMRALDRWRAAIGLVYDGERT